MSKKMIEFQCDVVHETVRIRLCKKYTGLISKGDPWVQCDQEECQYVEENRPPCPLDVSMFEDQVE